MTHSQRVVVTAGAEGIGREIARSFVTTGASVFACEIDANALKALEKEIPGVKTGFCDVSKRQDIERMIGEAVAVLGGLDVLVNNAGISGPTAPVEEMDPESVGKSPAGELDGDLQCHAPGDPTSKKFSGGH